MSCGPLRFAALRPVCTVGDPGTVRSPFVCTAPHGPRTLPFPLMVRSPSMAMAGMNFSAAIHVISMRAPFARMR